ncbi:hypothetical protein DIURU_002749 [Diutina rugosa]|uniref:BAR domain-containing protein n=1 Tax=Diutina rugosa TaxID=5481 RepID=A0A642UPC2_DIURU|nr:uncharacterized protein DIURU_002749 [Diutina rugosa]KAA8902640.1 hypothetical protein DIURU_002749 [Diutina rugosa]
MSFKFPSFSLESLQNSLPTMESVKESFNKVSKDIQPFAERTGQMINNQVAQLQQLASEAQGNAEVSELPADYLELERQCDALLRLYQELIQFDNDTYAKVSYDYPPGNYAINRLRDANVSGAISNKFNQLKNAASPQEFEQAILGGGDQPEENPAEDEYHIQQVVIPKTLYGHLATIAQTNADELQKSDSPIALVLMQMSSSYTEVALARLDQDKKINEVSHQLVQVLNHQFISVNELRKKVYAARAEFDSFRAKHQEDEENEELIAKEDTLVSATEVAVVEMKRLLQPSKNVDLLKQLAQAQVEYHQEAAKRLQAMLDQVKSVDVKDDEE